MKYILSHSRTLKTYEFATIEEAKEALRELVEEYSDQYYMEANNDMEAKNIRDCGECAPYIMSEKEYHATLGDDA